MDIDIRNCNNITSAKIAIFENKLNIKFAPNGTGKSTISKAIQYSVSESPSDLAKLLPFRYRTENKDKIKPEVIGIEGIENVMCFNEEYVNKFTFQPDELVSNSFDIFIRTESYEEKQRDIAEFTSAVQDKVVKNPELESLLSNLQTLSDAFKTTASGGLARNATGTKALSVANKIDHIPQGLELYKPFIQSAKSVSWIDWQSKGYSEFFELSDTCPFCTNNSINQKEQIAKVSKEYDKSLIKNLVNIINVINELDDYFSHDAKVNLAVIKSLKNGLEKSHETFIITVKSQIDDLIGKLLALKSLTGFDFKEDEKVSEKLPTYKIDMRFFNLLDSQKTSQAIEAINESIDELITKAGPLQGKINQQRQEMQKLIGIHQNDINEFLAFAGYRYRVEIAGEGEKRQLKLRHMDLTTHLSGGSEHLSYGERNAFSIVLFMYECLSKKPNLIILDDPISSFDKNKKYAILQMLFRRDAAACLKSKTVLMLTHDVEPIIDTLKSVKDQFSNQVKAAHLKLRQGIIVEQEIGGEDIKTFTQICKSIFESTKDPIIKLIYLRRRYEVLGELDNAYQVLSNLFKKRSDPEDHRIQKDEEGTSSLLSDEDLKNGIAEIVSVISTLPSDYSDLIEIFSDKVKIKSLYEESTNGYEKLQLTRMLLDINEVSNSVIRKFINETYHIENEFIFQLDPSHFDLIPEYVVVECDKILSIDM